ncbi:transcriptional repressor SdpR [Clostridium oryzae]|uniref:Transcriptional repressor SdpR n=1 Tax=Clostridium oryzae TaxID=1450648 RepID=A0A1V4ITG8_9CLOT|nr:transcriptional repressor SdpR [Clostridium oryzae]
MAVKIDIIKEKNFNIEFIYSPLFEMLCSIHVLVKPEHHLERIAWAEEISAKIPSKLYKTLNKFGMKTSHWCVVMDMCNIYDECDDFNIMAAINFLQDLNIKDFNKFFLKYAEDRIELFNKEEKTEMVLALKEYYLNYFERELRFMEPLLIRCLKRESEKCSKLGIVAYVDKLHGRIEVTKEAFLFHKYKLYQIPFSDVKRIVVRISSFINPHLLMDYGDDMVQFTANAHLSEGKDDVPMDLLKLMKALSDETRLKIIRRLHESRASTQSLAKDLKLTEACISKHLKILYDTELVYKERVGNYIYYYLNKFYIDAIPLTIYEYIG